MRILPEPRNWLFSLLSALATPLDPGNTFPRRHLAQDRRDNERRVRTAAAPLRQRHPQDKSYLARVPAGWIHPAEKDSRQINMLEHVLVAKPLRTLAGHALSGFNIATCCPFHHQKDKFDL